MAPDPQDAAPCEVEFLITRFDDGGVTVTGLDAVVITLRNENEEWLPNYMAGN